MAKGENIFRRRDGRWEARYIKGRELSGKIKYGYCYGKTYREAKVKAAKHKAALENGVLLPTATTQKQFSSYCLEWLHTKKCTVKESTYIKYSTVVNKHIMPKLGECCPLGFTTELMDNFIKELQFEDELAPKTVHDILVVLHGILKFASSKFAGSFPAAEINYPKIGKKEMRVLSREEQARLVAYLHEDMDSCRFGILLALCTGIRIGELCALQWESVSTNDKAIQERQIGSDEKIEFEVSGDRIQAVHMLPGYTHNIINLSETENLVTVMWANEQFDPDHPDTYFEEV